MDVREKEVQSLQSQALALSPEDAGIAEVDGQQRRVTDTFAQLQEPLNQRRQRLLASKEAHQFNRDLEDEIVRLTHLTHTHFTRSRILGLVWGEKILTPASELWHLSVK